MPDTVQQTKLVMHRFICSMRNFWQRETSHENTDFDGDLVAGRTICIGAGLYATCRGLLIRLLHALICSQSGQFCWSHAFRDRHMKKGTSVSFSVGLAFFIMPIPRNAQECEH